MKQWLSTRAQQTCQRLLFAFCAAIFIWWYVHESLIEERTFPAVPIYIRNIPAGKTISGLQKNNSRMEKNISLTLKGLRSHLSKIKPDQLEVTVNVTGMGEIWEKQLTTDDLHCLNPDINLETAILEIRHPQLQIHLTGKISREVPVEILSPVGAPPKGYHYLDTLPQLLFQSIEGPEEEVLSLSNRKINVNFDLNRVTKQELDRLAEHRAEGSELFYLIPGQWKRFDPPPPFPPSQSLNDAETLSMVFFLDKQINIDRPLPIRISKIPPSSSTDPIDKLNVHIKFDKNLMEEIDGIYYWKVPIYVQGVSHDFIEIIKEHLEIVVYIDDKGEISASCEIGNNKACLNKYTRHIRLEHPEIFPRRMSRTNYSGEGYYYRRDDALEKHLQGNFWKHRCALRFVDEGGKELSFQFSMDPSTGAITLSPSS